MKYEELRVVVQDMLTFTGATMILVNTLMLLIAVFITYFMARAKKKGELDQVNENFEILKRQQSEIASSTESIKQSLNHETISYKIKSEKFHEKQTEVIERLYQLLVEMGDVASMWLIKSSPNMEIGEEFKHAQSSIDEFIKYSKMNEIWVESNIYNDIESLALEIDKLIYGGTFTVDKDPQWNTAEYREAAKKYREHNKQIRQLITNTRKLLAKKIRYHLSPMED